MSSSFSRTFFVFACFFTLLTASVTVHAAPRVDQTAQSHRVDGTAKDTYRYLTLFADVLERTRADYVDDVTDEKMVENAINGMLMSLDPHSGYLNKKSFKDMQTQTSGRFGGLGIEVTMSDKLIKVISPIDGTPAARAGMQPNDLVTHLDGKPVTEMTLSEAVDYMRGTPGTKIVLTVRRGGLASEPMKVTIKRDIIRVRAVRSEIKGDIGYLRIITFNEQTQPNLDIAIKKAQKKLGSKLKGFVVDLRNNPGGLLDQAISVSSTFLPAGMEVVSTRSRHEEENQAYLSRGGDKTNGKPVVVLINGGSASASEIVAGALQDYRRAIVLGTKSFGKGSVQTIIPLGGVGAMRLTTARYYTPKGRSIQKSGIEPDIEVHPAKVETIEMGQGIREADLRGALSNDTMKKKKKKNKKKAKGKKGKKEKPFDYQLERALGLIRGIALYEQKTGPVGKALVRKEVKE